MMAPGLSVEQQAIALEARRRIRKTTRALLLKDGLSKKSRKRQDIWSRRVYVYEKAVLDYPPSSVESLAVELDLDITTIHRDIDEMRIFYDNFERNYIELQDRLTNELHKRVLYDIVIGMNREEIIGRARQKDPQVRPNDIDEAYNVIRTTFIRVLDEDLRERRAAAKKAESE
jgi:hypothetical protein